MPLATHIHSANVLWLGVRLTITRQHPVKTAVNAAW